MEAKVKLNNEKKCNRARYLNYVMKKKIVGKVFKQYDEGEITSENKTIRKKAN